MTIVMQVEVNCDVPPVCEEHYLRVTEPIPRRRLATSVRGSFSIAALPLTPRPFKPFWELRQQPSGAVNIRRFSQMLECTLVRLRHLPPEIANPSDPTSDTGFCAESPRTGNCCANLQILTSSLCACVCQRKSQQHEGSYSADSGHKPLALLSFNLNIRPSLSTKHSKHFVHRRS